MSTGHFRIESMAFGGAGVARHDGLVYFIEGASEGQLVTIKNLQLKKKFARADVDQVVEQVDYVRASDCDYFDRCGGCQWLDKEYRKQLEWKQSFVKNAINRIGGLEFQNEISIEPSAVDRQYRQRIRVNVETDRAGFIKCGFFSSGTHDLISIESCQIAVTAINNVLVQLPNLKSPASFKDRYSLELHALNHSDVALTLFLSPSDKKKADNLIDFWKGLKGVVACHVKGDTDIQPYVYDNQFGLDFYSKPGLFQQVNLASNRKVRERVFDIVKDVQAKNLLDLFCGTGNLSLGLAALSESILGVEYSKDAIDTAIYSVKKNNITNAKYIHGNASAMLRKFIEKESCFDLIIADPPREGMQDCLDSVIKLSPKHIVYMSCDPNTLARDLGKLCKTDYDLMSVECYDFFPNTFHVESLAVLKKADI